MLTRLLAQLFPYSFGPAVRSDVGPFNSEIPGLTLYEL